MKIQIYEYIHKEIVVKINHRLAETVPQYSCLWSEIDLSFFFFFV